MVLSYAPAAAPVSAAAAASAGLAGALCGASIIQEPDHVTLLGLIVAHADLGPQLDLLDRDRGLVLPGELGLLLLLVAVLGVVHHPAHGRAGLRRDLDEVEVLVPRVLQSLVGVLDADLRAVRVDQTHLGYPDPLVDAGGRFLRPLVEMPSGPQAARLITIIPNL
jgi:hypothetical protein